MDDFDKLRIKRVQAHLDEAIGGATALSRRLAQSGLATEKVEDAIRNLHNARKRVDELADR